MQACNQVQGWKPMSLDSFLDTRFSKDWSDHQLESHQSHLHHSQPGTIGSYENSKVQTNLRSASAAFLRPRPRPRPLPRPLGAPAASPWRFLQLHLWVNWIIWQKIWNHLKSEWKSKSFETDHLDACIHVLIIIYSTEYIYIYIFTYTYRADTNIYISTWMQILFHCQNSKIVEVMGFHCHLRIQQQLLPQPCWGSFQPNDQADCNGNLVGLIRIRGRCGWIQQVKGWFLHENNSALAGVKAHGGEALHIWDRKKISQLRPVKRNTPTTIWCTGVPII